MSAVYYISIILLVFGLPALLVLVIMALFKPPFTVKFFKKQWTRKRIAGVGAISLIVGVIGLSIIMNATMPESVRAEIAVQQKAEAAAKEKQVAEDKAAKKLQQEKEEAAKKPVVKTVTTKSPIPFTSSEIEDSTLPKGERKTTTTGVNGEKTSTYEMTYVKGKQTSKKLIKTEVTKKPTNEVVTVGTYVAPAPSSSPSSTHVTPAPSSSPSAYYANCTEARAAGVAPIYRGQPGYSYKLDRDHDGIACEQ